MLDYFLYEPLSFELPILVLICMTGMFLLVSSNDLFISYLALEIQSLSLYILAAWKQDNVKSIEAGLKYFFLGSFASGLILFGISIIYSFLGTTSYSDVYMLLLHMHINGTYLLGLYFAFLLILVGIFFKLGIAPFHYWLIDVYHGSPIIIVYIFSILPKISIIIFLIRFFSFILSYHYMVYNNFSYYLLSLIIFCSLFSIFIGSIGAMYQITFKKLLAYSSIANMGYILLGFCTTSVLGYTASIYYLFIYLLMSINLFSIILLIRRFPYCSKIVNLVDLASISHSNFILSFLLALTLLSLAGVPPLIGFFGKFLIISSLMAKEYYLLALYAVCFSVLTCIYYIRLIRFLLFIDYDKFPIFFIAPLSYRSSLFISFISLLNIFFFFFQGHLLVFINSKFLLCFSILAF
jgi:NADH-quinone oxidoreductase subunit N